MKINKLKQKVDWLFILPLIVLIVGVGTITNFSIWYTLIAGIIGGLIGFLLKFIFKKK